MYSSISTQPTANCESSATSKLNSNTLVFSLAIGGYDHLFNDCIKSHKHYAKIQGYDYSVITHTPWLLKAHDAAWFKLPLLISALDLGYEWVIFVDADCEIREFTPPIKIIGQTDKDLYFAPGISGRINSGVIVLKNTPVSREILETILSNADSEVLPENEAPYENGHFIQYVKDSSAYAPLEHKKWNNNSSLDPESFIQHYSGKKMRQYYTQNHVKFTQKLKKQVYLYIQKIFSSVPEKFKSEPTTLGRLRLLEAAYECPLSALLIQSIR